MSSQIVIGLSGYLLVVNVLVYAAMVLDKAKARNRARRISEATLLQLALIGGSIGTVIAQRTIRHKTHKEPFRTRLLGILALQAFALIALVAALVVARSPEALWRLLGF